MLFRSKLDEILNDSNLVLIDTRSYKEYSADHILGAVNLDLFAFHWFDTSKKGIENFNSQTSELFSFVGITNEKKVVFYDDVTGILAARGVWMLQYFSHPNVFILDGGIQKWKSENLPIETKTNPFKQEKFSGKTNDEILVGYEYIRDNLEKIKLVDARSKEEFDGTVVRDRKSTRLNSSHSQQSRMPSSA